MGASDSVEAEGSLAMTIGVVIVVGVDTRDVVLVDVDEIDVAIDFSGIVVVVFSRVEVVVVNIVGNVVAIVVVVAAVVLVVIGVALVVVAVVVVVVALVEGGVVGRLVVGGFGHKLPANLAQQPPAHDVKQLVSEKK